MQPVVKGDAPKQILRGIVITASLFAAALTIPVFGAFAILLIPLPVLFFRLKLGRRDGAIIPAVAFVLWLAMIGEVTADLFIYLEQLVLGFALGEFLERRLPLERIIGYAAGAVLLVAGGGLLVYTSATGIGAGKLLTDYMAENLALYREVYQNLGVPEENLKALSSAFEYIQYVLVRLMPGLSIAAALFGAWICLLFTRPLLKMGRLPAPPVIGALNRWKAPEPLVWGVIGCGGMMILPDTVLKLVGLNGLIVLLQIYFFQGIAIVSFYFDKKKMPIALRWVMFSLIALQIYVLVFVIGLGFFDMWLDFRKIKQPTETNGVS
ncbi:MAG: YybS family protein [Pseudomonadota bacterium]